MKNALIVALVGILIGLALVPAERYPAYRKGFDAGREAGLVEARAECPPGPVLIAADLCLFSTAGGDTARIRLWPLTVDTTRHARPRLVVARVDTVSGAAR